MNKPIENIIAKVLAGEASNDEIKFVEKWRKENPGKFDEYNNAYSLNIFESKEFSESLFDEKRSNLNQSTSITFINRYSVLFKIAAVFIGMAIIGSLYFYNKSLDVIFTNNCSELAYISLPDGSHITLDENSTIQYNKGWFHNFNRNVVLKGKAYFDITKKEGRTFVVNTSKLGVTVLGTRFTVNELSNKTQFILTEGKVKLSGPAIDENLIIDKPGNQVIVSDSEVIINNIVDQNLYASWLNNKIYFNNCTVSQVINMLYNSYNLKVEIINPELQNKKVFGSAPSDDAELIVEALSQILNTKLETGEPRE